MNNKYYAVKSNDLARALVFVTGERYYIFEDKRDGGKIYSFLNTDKLQRAIKELDRLQKEL